MPVLAEVESEDLRNKRLAVARAKKAVRKNPNDPSARAELERVGRAYAEVRMEAVITDTVNRFPAISAAQAARLSLIMQGVQA